jgi:hypothetical protein
MTGSDVTVAGRCATSGVQPAVAARYHPGRQGLEQFNQENHGLQRETFTDFH